MTSVQANGITIEYDEVGTGEPLLLVMGLNGQLIDWPAAFVDALVERNFRVIRFDNRDAGLSTEVHAPAPTPWQIARSAVLPRRSKPAYTVPDLARDAAGLLDALGIESAHVAGMSMGGMIAQQLAIDFPERVRSLTSIMSTTGNPKVGRPKPKIVWQFLRRKPVPADEALEGAVDLFRQISGPTFDEEDFRVLAKASLARSYRPAGTARQLAGIIASPDRTAGLRRVSVPTLVVHGTLDPLVRRSGGIATAEAVRGSRLVMFNDMGHDIPSTRCDEIAAEIRLIADRA